MDKNIKRSLLTVLFLALLTVVMVLILRWYTGSDKYINRHKTATVDTFNKEAPEDMYSMTYSDSFCFDEYLAQGYIDSQSKGEFINERVMGSMLEMYGYKDHDCSAFICRNENGEVLFCRNFDTSAVAPCCMVTTGTEDGYRTIGGCNLGMAYNPETKAIDLEGARKALLLALPYYSHDGMNEYGVAIAILSCGVAVTEEDESKKYLDPFDVIRIVLEKSKSVDEAIALLNTYSVDFGPVYDCSPFHFFLADSTGKSVVIDYSTGKPVEVEADCVTNFNLYGDSRGIGRDRYDIIESTLSGKDGILNEADALQLLSDVCMKNMERYSVIYNLSTGAVTAFSLGDCSVTANLYLNMADR